VGLLANPLRISLKLIRRIYSLFNKIIISTVKANFHFILTRIEKDVGALLLIY